MHIHSPQRCIIHIIGIPHIPYTQTCNTCLVHTYMHTHLYAYTHTHKHSIACTTVLYTLTPPGPPLVTFNEAEETTLWAPKAAVACIHSMGSGPPKPPWPASTPQALGSQSRRGLHPLHGPWAPRAAVACIHSMGPGPPEPPWPASTPLAHHHCPAAHSLA